MEKSVSNVETYNLRKDIYGIHILNQKKAHGPDNKYYNQYVLYLTCNKCKFAPVKLNTWQNDPTGEGSTTIDKIDNAFQKAIDNDEDFDFDRTDISIYPNVDENIVGSALVDCSHDFSNISFDDDYHWKQCSKCSGIQKNTLSLHILGKAKSALGGSGYHVYECNEDGCDYVKKEAHVFDANGNCTVNGCTGKKVIDCEHDFSNVYSDNTNHWIGCNLCGEIKGESVKKHTFGKSETNSNGIEVSVCTHEECGYISKKYSEEYVLEENNNNNSNDNNKTNTQIQGTIPYAGSKTIIIWILVIATIGIISFIKFKKAI